MIFRGFTHLCFEEYQIDGNQKQFYFITSSELDPYFIEQICTNAKNYENRWTVCLEFKEVYQCSEYIDYRYLAPFLSLAHARWYQRKHGRRIYVCEVKPGGPTTVQDWRPITVI